MKQKITQEQLLEINKEQSDKLLGWMMNRGYYDSGQVDLTIGQMIEYLNDHWNTLEQKYDKTDGDEGEFNDRSIYRCADACWYIRDEETGKTLNSNGETPELCDALWEAVKESLNN